MKLIHKLTAGLGILGLLAAVTFPALAADTAGVTATVTVQTISITVSDGEVLYGILDADTSKDTTSGIGQLNDTQTATNNGNVNETFLIRGKDSDWTLAGTNGVNQYVHQFCTEDPGTTADSCDTSPVYTALTTINQALTTAVYSPGAIQKFDLKITTPTSSSVSTQQSVDVTVVAVSAV